MAEKDQPAHQPGTKKGEEVPKQEGGSGRQETGKTGQANRPAGKSRPSDFTGINPQDEKPIDPQSPQVTSE